MVTTMTSAAWQRLGQAMALNGGNGDLPGQQGQTTTTMMTTTTTLCSRQAMTTANNNDLPGQPVLPQGQTTAMTLTTWVACMVTGMMSTTTTDLGSHMGW